MVLAYALKWATVAAIDLSFMTQNKVWVRGVLSCLRVMVALKRITPWSIILTGDGRSITDLVDHSLLPWLNTLVAQLVWRNSTSYGARRLLHPHVVDPDITVERRKAYKGAWRLLRAWEEFLDAKRTQWVPYRTVS